MTNSLPGPVTMSMEAHVNLTQYESVPCCGPIVSICSTSLYTGEILAGCCNALPSCAICCITWETGKPGIDNCCNSMGGNGRYFTAAGCTGVAKSIANIVTLGCFQWIRSCNDESNSRGDDSWNDCCGAGNAGTERDQITKIAELSFNV